MWKTNKTFETVESWAWCDLSQMSRNLTKNKLGKKWSEMNFKINKIMFFYVNYKSTSLIITTFMMLFVIFCFNVMEKCILLDLTEERKSNSFETTWRWMTEFSFFWVNIPFMLVFTFLSAVSNEPDTNILSRCACCVSLLIPQIHTDVVKNDI